MSTGLFSIGVSGMSAAQMGLLTAEHNIANAKTEGYNRQRTHQATNIAMMTGSGSMGQGTHVSTVERMYDQFLSGQVNRSQTNVSELDTYYSKIAQIDNMLADQNAGLSPAMQEFFKGVQQVAADPSSLTARQSMISSGQAMVSRYETLQSRLEELAGDVNGQISSVVQGINSYAQQIANLNDRIVVAESAMNQPSNDLRDQRDQLVNDLNNLVKVDTTVDSNGGYNVFIGSGQQLVVGSNVSTMTFAASSSDPQRIVVGLKQVGGNVLELPESLVTGGQLGGLVKFRKESLDPAFNDLGKVAASMALTFNAQHALGQNLLGQISGEAGFVGGFFNITQPRVVANAHNNAASSVVSATLNAPPPSNGENFYTDLTGSDYSLRAIDPTTFVLTRLSDNYSWPAGDVTAINSAANSQGFSIGFGAGSFAANDSYTIQPTRMAAGGIEVNTQIAADTRLIAASAPVRTNAELTNTGSMKLAQGAVGQGYSVAGLPATVTASATQLSGFPVAAVATYSDGTTLPAAANVDLVNGSAFLTKVSFSGMSFDISGKPGAGDTFTIERNNASSGIADGRNILALGKLQTQKTMAGGMADFQTSYAQLVSDVGNKTREIQVTSKAQRSLLEQSTSARESYSGVNLDEEAANLIRYQQAYQASAKMLSIGSKLFETLLSL